MKTTFHSDNGKPCFQCRGTIFTYHCDDAVSLVDTVCVSCNARDLFTARQTPKSPSQASAAHRGEITLTKPVFNFYFADEPQRTVIADRAWLANALRAYRKQSARYNLKRVGMHFYTVTCGSAIAVIST
jgi:hypothetical protein